MNKIEKDMADFRQDIRDIIIRYGEQESMVEGACKMIPILMMYSMQIYYNALPDIKKIHWKKEFIDLVQSGLDKAEFVLKEYEDE